VAFSQFPVPTRYASTGLDGVQVTGAEDQSSWPIKTELNDVAFTNYHEFGSEARIVTAPAQTQTQSPPQ
jgi:hypothetical protein